MPLTRKAALLLTLGIALSLSACKPKPGEPTAQTQAAAAAATAAAPATAPAPTTAPVTAPAAAPAQASAAAIAELDKIAVIAKPLPPFPFIDYPAIVHEALRSTDESDFDQISVIVGNKLHTVEGRFKRSVFSLDDAKISEFQAKRDYTKAVLDMGGVKVNTAMPHDEAFYEANGMGGEATDARGQLRYDLDKKTKYEAAHTYDVYFLPTATGRKWLVLMISDDKVRLLAVEEKTAASSVKLAALAP